MESADNNDHILSVPEDFYKSEIRSGYEIGYNMKQVWACQLNLLSELQKTCEKYGLRYWLDSGSLLGAIRHKGYIPWDDDIDVVMFRDDYDRLLELAPKEFKPPIIFQSAYTEKNFVRGHAQMRDTSTSAIIPSEIYKDFNQGIFIDIFILDGVSNDPEIEYSQNKKANRLRAKLEILARPMRQQHIKTIIKAIRYRIKFPGIQGKARLYKMYEDIFRDNSLEKCDYVATTTFRTVSEKRNRHIYDTTLMVDFEYMKQPVPAGYDELLTLLYGDYMEPVKIPSMHGTLILDVNTPADIKIKELRKKICKL